MSKLVGWILYIALLIVVVITGWEQPLKVHFVSKQSAGADPAAQVQVPDGNMWMHDDKRWDTVNRAMPNSGQTKPQY